MPVGLPQFQNGKVSEDDVVLVILNFKSDILQMKSYILFQGCARCAGNLAQCSLKKSSSTSPNQSWNTSPSIKFILKKIWRFVFPEKKEDGMFFVVLFNNRLHQKVQQKPGELHEGHWYWPHIRHGSSQVTICWGSNVLLQCLSSNHLSLKIRFEWGRIMGRWKQLTARWFCWRLAVNITCPGGWCQLFWRIRLQLLAYISNPQAPVWTADHAGHLGTCHFLMLYFKDRICLAFLSQCDALCTARSLYYLQKIEFE